MARVLRFAGNISPEKENNSASSSAVRRAKANFSSLLITTQPAIYGLFADI
jgi:hypothetical protein